jgi:flavodoxin I
MVKNYSGTTTDGYSYKYSAAERDGQFVGFPFDRVNEADKTDERFARWIDIVKAELPAYA